jgi:hypothetical protein
MRPANPNGLAAGNPGDVRAHVPDFQRHNLDWDLLAAWAAPAFQGRRPSGASTDALAGLPVLAVVRHLTPRPRFTWQCACIVIALRSQDLHDRHSMRTTVLSDVAWRDWRRPHRVIARSEPAGPVGPTAWMKRVDPHRNLMVRSRALARRLEPWAARPSFETRRFSRRSSG